jgi:hypothetical protein
MIVYLGSGVAGRRDVEDSIGGKKWFQHLGVSVFR